ncbi:hypothetical protein CONPUDRAFT_142036 [Coniophora puteana RWD-64-598 SS2]|uniref:F-box domain-containing protein n=1 Tax=Coniophora puteana (strain RWD-64-598) TaxID=741705 RepID=A0A5M3N2J2_CONPW|nr:uncharacterized protein CONPUDRAFT_142036 [Coniophora puteana RWD-64-598 SS2]EIW85497.1 hypothetical protein CONPUDRAFT_142036 [Coniophora puteana RWD-64-598 SS2]
MHRALFIAEVAQNIACHRYRKRDIAAFAQTCRALSAPALDVLWSVLDSIIPLLCALPSDLISRPDSASSTIRYRLLRPITPADWSIFRKYASRVRELRAISPLNQDQSPFIDIEILRALCWSPTFGLLFPKLRALEWSGAHSETLPFLRTLLGPSITDLILDLETPDAIIFNLVANLSTMCPHIKVFMWSRCPGNDSEEEAAILSQAITSWKDLHELACPLDGHAMNHLTSIPTLHALHIQLVGKASYPTLEDRAYPALRTLQIIAPLEQSSPNSVESFMRASFFKLRLDSFLGHTHYPKQQTLGDLCMLLPDCIDTSTLKDVNIVECRWTRSLALQSSALGPLLQFHKLTVVNIDTPREIDLDDAALLDMAHAWPTLTSLKINPVFGWRLRSRVSLHGLCAVIRQLPGLSTLSIAIDADGAALDAIDEEYGQFLVTRPFALDLLDSRVGVNYAEVAAFFSALFPGMAKDSDILYWRFPGLTLPVEMANDSRVHRERWAIVVSTVLAMNRIRRIEQGRRLTAVISPP